MHGGLGYGHSKQRAMLEMSSPNSLGNLLDDLRLQKEKQHTLDTLRLASRRSLLLCVPLLLLCAWVWLRTGSESGAGAGAGAGATGAASTERRIHCFFLLDRTGSMSSIRSAVLGGFNDFLTRQQAQPGSMWMTLAQFNSAAPFELRFESRDVHAVAPLDSFDPSGTTPLYDALAMLIEHAAKAEAAEEREVVIAVFTDGKENASRKFSRDQARSSARSLPPIAAPPIAAPPCAERAVRACCSYASGVSDDRAEAGGGVVLRLSGREPGLVRGLARPRHVARSDVQL